MSQRRPFCKVCRDSGKPEQMYTSHYVKDLPGPKGVVVCPTLLAMSCQRCRKKGHMRSRCPFRETRKPRSRTQRISSVDSDGFVAVVKRKSTGADRLVKDSKMEDAKVGLENSFSGLDLSDDDEEEESVEDTAEQPPDDMGFGDFVENSIGYQPTSGSLWADDSDEE